MKLTLESAVDFSKSNAMSMKHHFDNEHDEDLNPIITMYSKDVEAPLFQIILPMIAMEEKNKRVAYMMALSVAGFIDADYVTMTNDVFMSKADSKNKTKEQVIDESVRPSTDPNSVEALLVLGMSKDRGLVFTQEYGRDDIGKMFFKDSMSDTFTYKDVYDEELDRSWMARIGAMSLSDIGMETVGIKDDDYDTKLELLWEAMSSMDDLDFMIAYSNFFGDYMHDKFYRENLKDTSKEMLEAFKEGSGGFPNDDE